MKKTNICKPLYAKPVHPRAARTHAMLGLPFVRQHMIFDSRWTTESVEEQFKGMTDLLAKRLAFEKTETASKSANREQNAHSLKKQCDEGRMKLNNVLRGDNKNKIRNLFINNQQLQRLYQDMPVEKVREKMDHRTFVMRKHRDRLQYKLEKMKEELLEKTRERDKLELRVKFQNDFKLKEEERASVLRKKIANSTIRLNANKTIGTAYSMLIKVLQHDSLFLNPIMASLEKDAEDQEKFIQHILFLGLGAIAKSKKLDEKYQRMDEKARKMKQRRLKKIALARKNISHPSAPKQQKPENEADIPRRYVRETYSMVILKNQLEVLETTIKDVKYATLCSQAMEIYPRIKSQTENNRRLEKAIKTGKLVHKDLEQRMKNSKVLEGILIHNLSEQEIDRLNRIKALEEQIKMEDELSNQTLQNIKARNKFTVMLRLSVWNLFNILRLVGHTPKPSQPKYPRSYLNLPLLHFEMPAKYSSYPPEPMEENIEEIMRILVRKVYILMREYHSKMSPERVEDYVRRYEDLYFASLDALDDMSGDITLEDEMDAAEEDEEIIDESKPVANVPTNEEIKERSAKIVQEHARKEEM